MESLPLITFQFDSIYCFNVAFIFPFSKTASFCAYKVFTLIIIPLNFAVYAYLGKTNSLTLSLSVYIYMCIYVCFGSPGLFQELRDIRVRLAFPSWLKDDPSHSNTNSLHQSPEQEGWAEAVFYGALFILFWRKCFPEDFPLSVSDHNYILGPVLVSRKDGKVSIWHRGVESHAWLRPVVTYLGLSEGPVF